MGQIPLTISGPLQKKFANPWSGSTLSISYCSYLPYCGLCSVIDWLLKLVCHSQFSSLVLSFMTSDLLVNFSEIQVPHLQKGDIIQFSSLSISSSEFTYTGWVPLIPRNLGTRSVSNFILILEYLHVYNEIFWAWDLSVNMKFFCFIYTLCT